MQAWAYRLPNLPIPNESHFLNASLPKLSTILYGLGMWNNQILRCRYGLLFYYYYYYYIIIIIIHSAVRKHIIIITNKCLKDKLTINFDHIKFNNCWKYILHNINADWIDMALEHYKSCSFTGHIWASWSRLKFLVAVSQKSDLNNRLHRKPWQKWLVSPVISSQNEEYGT